MPTFRTELVRKKRHFVHHLSHNSSTVDRASFQGSSLKGAIFANTVLTGTSFENADVENVDFSDAYLGDFDIRALCRNPSLKGENPKTGVDTRASVGCK